MKTDNFLYERKPCLIYSSQDELIRRVKGFLFSLAEIIPITKAQNVSGVVRQYNPAVLFIDLLSPQALSVLESVFEEWPLTTIIAFGADRSEPVLAAQQTDVFAIERHDCSRPRLQSLFRSASRFSELLEERELLKREVEERRHLQNALNSETHNRKIDQIVLREVLQSFTQTEDVHDLLKRTLEWLRHEGAMSQVGAFLNCPGQNTYKLEAAIKCPEEVKTLHFQENSPLVQWLKYNPSAISRRALTEITPLKVQRQLSQTLKKMYAEAIIPLHSGRELLGWIFVGRSTTGQSLSDDRIIEISSIADYLSTVVERRFVQHQNTLHRRYFENILNMLPAGVVLYDQNAEVLWWNRTVREIIPDLPASISNQSCKILGSRLADFVLNSVLYTDDSREVSATQWSPPDSEQIYLVESYPSPDDKIFPGNLLLFHNVTTDMVLEETNRKVHRNQVISELAQRLSAGIRSPLVTIKTFVQLLPERYRDAEFRNNFVHLVSDEVNRLDHLSEDIHNVILPEEYRVAPVSLKEILRQSIKSAIHVTGGGLDIGITSAFTQEAAELVGDKKSLLECFTQILSIAISNCTSTSKPSLRVTLSVDKDCENQSICVIKIEGNKFDAKLDSLERQSDDSASGKNASAFSFLENVWEGESLKMVKRTLTSHHGSLSLGKKNRSNYFAVKLPLGGNEVKVV